MTQTNCPRCDSTRLEYQENYGYWGCDDCGHAWALDADDPDYDEEQIEPLSPAELADYDDSVSCWDCHGTGRVYILDSPIECTECKGTGYI
ncbi:MAG: hypothetical protein V7K27_19900 [Nostoc sp.]|uniref:hypothetical protein n=1 Tax=Nostoc sp. TaxID=1180 RepID=UPI002FFCD4E9